MAISKSPIAPGPTPAQAGFTLVELVIVIVILGIVSSAVVVFVKGPLEAYFASTRRAALTDAADTVLRRMERDIRLALPNSLRTPSSQCLELIPTKTGGRYRSDGSAAALSMDSADSSFNMLGLNSALPPAQRIAAGDVVVVYNLGPSVPQADAYLDANTSAVTSLGTEAGGETPINITSKQFPLESASKRFQVVPGGERVVSYVCSGGNLTRTVTAGSFTSDCPTSGPVIAAHASCTFDYSGDDLSRNAVARLALQLQSENAADSVQLQQEVHVSNTP